MIRDGNQIRSMIFDQNGIYAENDVVLLRRIEDADRESYLDIYRAKPMWQLVLSEPALQADEGLWNMFVNPAVLNTVIIRKADGKFCGFCGLQAFTDEEEPELSIELLEECQHQGIGTAALPLLMSKFSQAVGANKFYSRVKAGNLASQKLMRKVGGVPAGIMTIPGYSEEMIKSMEESDEAQPEWIPELAVEFNTTPQKLRSHALVFHFEV